VDTGLTAKQTMLKARAAGAEAIEVLIKEMREAPRANERLDGCQHAARPRLRRAHYGARHCRDQAGFQEASR
jgi:hypothetical protein